MKKTLILVALMIFATNVSANEIKDTRKAVAVDLNETVVKLKDYFRPVDKDLADAKDESLDLYSDAKRLKENSQVDESNPTALEHARGGTIADCDARNQELNWNGTKWECQDIEYIADCQPTDGEEKVDDGKGGNTCVLKGNYANQSLGWGICNDSKGEKETQVGCMFTKNSDGKGYQVEGNLCSNNVDRFKQPCGTNGGNSSCKCPSGYKYEYKDGVASCVYGDIISHIATTKHTSAGSLSSSIADNRLAMSGRGADTKSCRHDKMTVKFNLQKSKVDSVSLRFFFKRGGRVYVNDKIIFGVAGAMSIKKSFKKIVAHSKTYSSSGGDRWSSSNDPIRSQGLRLCGSVYHNSGAYTLENDGNCAYTCDLKNNRTSDRVFGAKWHNISLDNFVEGENTVTFDRVWGNYGGTDSATFVFNPKNSGAEATKPLPECKI
jgi:hypothetical protein